MHRCGSHSYTALSSNPGAKNVTNSCRGTTLCTVTRSTSAAPLTAFSPRPIPGRDDRCPSGNGARGPHCPARAGFPVGPRRAREPFSGPPCSLASVAPGRGQAPGTPGAQHCRSERLGAHQEGWSGRHLAPVQIDVTYGTILPWPSAARSLAGDSEACISLEKPVTCARRVQCSRSQIGVGNLS